MTEPYRNNIEALQALRGGLAYQLERKEARHPYTYSTRRLRAQLRALDAVLQKSKEIVQELREAARARHEERAAFHAACDAEVEEACERMKRTGK